MLSDVRNIPRIMRRLHWDKGAAVLDNWFNRGVDDHTPDTTTITIDWVLGFARARKVYDKIIQDRIWANAPAQKEIAKMLGRYGLMGSSSPLSTTMFGYFSLPVAKLDVDYVNERSA